MKYQWLEEELPNCEELTKELGCKVNSITKGVVVVGQEEGFDEGGNPAILPITRKGIELDLDTPTEAQLKVVDRKLISLRREGSKGITQEIDELKSRVAKLEKK